jgi:hypothetical protein
VVADEAAPAPAARAVALDPAPVVLPAVADQAAAVDQVAAVAAGAAAA